MAQLRQTAEMTYTGIGISQSGSNSAFITEFLRTNILRNRNNNDPADSDTLKSSMIPLFSGAVSIIGHFVFFFFYTRTLCLRRNSVSSACRRFQRIDCFSYGGENTLYINERPSATEDKINDPQVFMAVTCRDRLNKCLFLASARPRLVSFTRRKGKARRFFLGSFKVRICRSWRRPYPAHTHSSQLTDSPSFPSSSIRRRLCFSAKSRVARKIHLCTTEADRPMDTASRLG